MGMLMARHRAEGEEEAERPPVPVRDPDAYDDLTDEQVAEAYATNVDGNATSRKGRLKALRALDAEAATIAEAPASE